MSSSHLAVLSLLLITDAINLCMLAKDEHIVPAIDEIPTTPEVEAPLHVVTTPMRATSHGATLKALRALSKDEDFTFDYDDNQADMDLMNLLATPLPAPKKSSDPNVSPVATSLANPMTMSAPSTEPIESAAPIDTSSMRVVSSVVPSHIQPLDASADDAAQSALSLPVVANGINLIEQAHIDEASDPSAAADLELNVQSIDDVGVIEHAIDSHLTQPVDPNSLPSSNDASRALPNASTPERSPERVPANDSTHDHIEAPASNAVDEHAIPCVSGDIVDGEQEPGVLAVVDVGAEAEAVQAPSSPTTLPESTN
jgi:hypothetical protein